MSVKDNDADPSNEIQNLSSSSSGTDRIINITSGSGVVFSVADNDNSSSNEIQHLSSSSSGTNRTINITGGGNSTIINVADNDNSSTNELDSKWSNGAGTIYHTSSNVSVGTNSSGGYRLHVDGNLGVSMSAFKAGGGSWAVYSDGRLTDDISPYTDGLKHVMSIRPISFTYNELSGYPDLEKRYIGIVA